ncbi:MAG TPA: methyltransferase domain-containing protein [Hyphomicrobiaceae bacterium]|nr:methyltransferase domain-containing protein [Hyphomicrobiaceae bacterium]
MTTVEEQVAQHYTHGALGEAIHRGLESLGRSADDFRDTDLAGMDEFHMGGREATAALAEKLDLKPAMSLLDIGCGIGGAARYFARTFGCHATGIDLTPEYVETARTLTKQLGLAEKVEFRVGSALDLPFADASFDAATLLHVGMNIPDKRRLASQVHRVLKQGATFGVFDAMRTGPGPIAYPVPWAARESTSFVESPAEYREVLQAAGFVVVSERNQRQMALDFFARIRSRMAASGPPPLGLHILMGQDAPLKIANLVTMLEQGTIAPIEIIAKRH